MNADAPASQDRATPTEPGDAEAEDAGNAGGDDETEGDEPGGDEQPNGEPSEAENSRSEPPDQDEALDEPSPPVFEGWELEMGFAEVIGTPLPAFVDGVDRAVGRAAPRFRAQSARDGRLVEVDPADGTARIVVFVAHWCPHCQAELPRIVTLVELDAVPSDVEIVMVSTSVDAGAPNHPPSAWFEREGWTGDVLVDDALGALAEGFGLNAFPYFVVIDGNGAVITRAAGEQTEAQLAELVLAASPEPGDVGADGSDADAATGHGGLREDLAPEDLAGLNDDEIEALIARILSEDGLLDPSDAECAAARVVAELTRPEVEQLLRAESQEEASSEAVVVLQDALLDCISA